MAVELMHAYLQDSPVGSGWRWFIIVQRSGTRLRLLYVPTLRCFWARSADINWPDVKMAAPSRGLAGRIRRERRMRVRLGMPFAKAAVRAVLDQLRPGKPTQEDVLDDQMADDDRLPDNEEETDVTTEPTTAADQAVTTNSADDSPTPTQKANAKKAKARERARERRASAKREAEKAAKATTKKATKTEKAAKTATGGGTRTQITDDHTIKLLKPDARPNSKYFALIKPGMTVGNYIKAVEKIGATRAYARTELHYNKNMGAISFEAPR